MEKFNPHGLTSDEAALQLKKSGFNELKSQKNFSYIKIFLNQLKSPLIYVLFLAGLATFFLGHLTDGIIILLTVLINIFLGFYQEQKSQKAMLALNSLMVPLSKVIRDGQQQIIQSKNLVSKDLVILTIGTKVPADGILVESTDLTVDEAIMTGESIAVKKIASLNFGISESALERQENLVFAGTTIMTGIAKMLVTKTGMKTRIGKMGKSLINIQEERTPLQNQINKIAKYLALMAAGAASFIFFLGQFLRYETLEIFTTSVAVAVASIPEGLAATITVILSLGMQRILRKNALVRQLISVETLGSVSVICADKTGTLTEGQMKVIESIDNNQLAVAKEKLIEAAILCNDMRDPLEVAMMDWALKKKQVSIQGKLFNKDSFLKKYPRLDEVPFSPSYKYIATLHTDSNLKKVENKNILFFSGAPEIILSKCKISNEQREKWIKEFSKYGERGNRLVGFAYKEISKTRDVIHNTDLKGFQWLGILVYEDPIRLGVKEVLGKCQKAGVKVKVITGDYLNTAMAVLKKLGIGDHQKVIDGDALSKMSFEELKKEVGKIILFARTTPEQKLKIVQALKENGETVAMMGDGVNDSPALKQADIGIVVNKASDLAKENADMILLDSDFTTIIEAIEEGRSIFENIKKAILYLLSHSFVEMILVVGSLFSHLPLPITAVQILWINLFQDSFPAVALAFEPREKFLMDEPPRRKESPIIDLQMGMMLLTVGIIGPLVLTLMVVASLKNWLPFYFSQSLVFGAIGVISLFVIFACRSLKRNFAYDFWKNKILMLALLISMILLLAAIYLPSLQKLLKTQALSLKEWLFLIVLGVFNLLVLEIVKRFFFLKKKSSSIINDN